MQNTQLDFHQELRQRFGMPSGIGALRCNGANLRIEFNSLVECDQILESPDQLCNAAIALGFRKVTFKVINTQLVFKFGLQALRELSRMLDQSF